MSSYMPYSHQAKEIIQTRLEYILRDDFAHLTMFVKVQIAILYFLPLLSAIIIYKT